MAKLLAGSTVDGKNILTSDDYSTLTSLIATTAAKVNGVLNNLGFTAITGSKTLTFALKGADGNDPSASNVVSIAFRDATLTVGKPVLRTVQTPLSIVISSGSTLGFGYLDCWPEGDSTTYVKTTSAYSGSDGFYTANPGVCPTGVYTQSWLSNSVVTNQRFHIDLGEAKVITRVLYENQHHNGGSTTSGAKNFTLWGSNEASAFADTTYATDTNWTQLTTDISQLVEHVASDASDPHYIKVTNNTAYRYYAFKFADNWGHATFMGVRKLVLQESEYGRIYLWAIDNAGTVELAVSKSALMFDESNLVTTTAEGGAGAADSDSIMYSTAARSNVAVRCLGYVDITTGAVAGEWDFAPIKLQIMGPGVHRSGEVIQVVTAEMGYLMSTTTTIPYGRIRPVNTQGAEALTCSITPNNICNKLIISAKTSGGYYATIAAAFLTIFRDSRIAALAAGVFNTSTYEAHANIECSTLVKSLGTTTFKLRFGPHASGTIYINSGDDITYTGLGGKRLTSIKIMEVAA